MGPQEYVDLMLGCYENGATLLGGCCGTTPAHMKALVDAVKG